MLLGGVFSVEETAEDNFLDSGPRALFLRLPADFLDLLDEPLADLSDGVIILVSTEAERADEEVEEGLGTMLRMPLETGTLAVESPLPGVLNNMKIGLCEEGKT